MHQGPNRPIHPRRRKRMRAVVYRTSTPPPRAPDALRRLQTATPVGGGAASPAPQRHRPAARAAGDGIALRRAARSRSRAQAPRPGAGAAIGRRRRGTTAWAGGGVALAAMRGRDRDRPDDRSGTGARRALDGAPARRPVGVSPVPSPPRIGAFTTRPVSWSSA
jgi:hypothetical protein